MISLKRLFRTEYSGENVTITRTLHNQVWETVEQYFPYTGTVSPARAAVVIGNGTSRLDFDLNHILNHPGGFEGEQRLETYSCNAAYRDFITNYLIVTSDVIANDLEFAIEVADLKYIGIFANAMLVIKHASLQLLPQNPFLDAGSAAAYLAAFNGRKKVFLLGFDGQDTPDYNNNVYADTVGYNSKYTNLSDTMWVDNMKMIFDTYYDTQFIRVMPSEDANVPESWKYCLNFKQIDFRGLVLACNL